MSQLSIRLIQTSCIDGNIAANLGIALQAIADSANQADLVVFPETFISGFPTPDNIAQLAESSDGHSISAIRAAAKAAGVSVAIGFAENSAGHFFNSALLINEYGDILLKYRKSHLYASDLGVFEAGHEFPVCEWHGYQVGMLICFDLEFPESARALARAGADLILIPDGMMHPYGHLHRMMLPVRAMENQLYAVLVNRVGTGDKYAFCGQSHVADPFGASLVVADAEFEQIVNVQLDMTAVTRARKEFNYVEIQDGTSSQSAT